MNKKFYDVKIILEKSYKIEPIITVEEFKLSFSKFTKLENHFLVKTTGSSYFLKKNKVFDLKKVAFEADAILKFKDIIRIPEIIQTKTHNHYIMEHDDLYVLYEYVDAQNLKDLKEKEQLFFDILCDIESKFIKLKPQNQNFYDFQPRIFRFESNAKKLLEVLKNDARPHASRDIEYVKFLIKEVEKTKSQILSLKIPKNFIHGDFIMQNVIRDSNKVLWIVDWEKSCEYITSVDVMKSITFTFFDPSKEGMNLEMDKFIKWLEYCFQKISLSKEEWSNIFVLYYFHLITGIDFPVKFYIEKQNLNEKMIAEDFLICKWFKKNKKEMQESLNKILF